MKRKPSVKPGRQKGTAQRAVGTFKNILIGGEAGQGLQTVGHLLAKSLVRSGYSIHVTQTYESRVRGGHNTFSIRFGPQRVLAGQEQIDIRLYSIIYNAIEEIRAAMEGMLSPEIEEKIAKKKKRSNN
jgi:hypothetical protein